MRKFHPVNTALVARGETHRECARAVGINPSLFSQVVNGHAAAWPALRRRLAEHLDIPEADLFPEATR